MAGYGAALRGLRKVFRGTFSGPDPIKNMMGTTWRNARGSALGRSVAAIGRHPYAAMTTAYVAPQLLDTGAASYDRYRVMEPTLPYKLSAEGRIHEKLAAAVRLSSPERAVGWMMHNPVRTALGGYAAYQLLSALAARRHAANRTYASTLVGGTDLPAPYMPQQEGPVIR